MLSQMILICHWLFYYLDDKTMLAGYMKPGGEFKKSAQRTIIINIY
jgi:hypothetical protein